MSKHAIFYNTHRSQTGSLLQEMHVAYRQLACWCWQWLGREIRVVLPSCAITRIRSEFPSTSGTMIF